MKRHGLTRGQSRRNFRRGHNVRRINYAPTIMRGGIRL